MAWAWAGGWAQRCCSRSRRCSRSTCSSSCSRAVRSSGCCSRSSVCRSGRRSSGSRWPRPCCSSRCGPGCCATCATACRWWRPTRRGWSAGGRRRRRGHRARRPRQARRRGLDRPDRGQRGRPGRRYVRVVRIAGATAIVARHDDATIQDSGAGTSAVAVRSISGDHFVSGTSTGDVVDLHGPRSRRPLRHHRAGPLRADRAAGQGVHRRAPGSVLADAGRRAAPAHPVLRPGPGRRRPARAGRLLPAPAGDHLRQPRREHRHGDLLPGHRASVGRLRDRELHPGHRAADRHDAA